MSHFSVIVATKDYPSEEVLTKELQPFQEFECTGIDDQYVQDIDITADCRSEYEAATESKLRDQAGVLHDPYDHKFFRDPTPEESLEIGLLAGSGSNGTIR